MNRRHFLQLSAATATSIPLLAKAAPDRDGFKVKPFAWDEFTIPQFQEAFDHGKLSSANLTRAYRKRIEQLDHSGPALRSVIELNPDALEIAHSLDNERKIKGPRGPMHGIPVLIKDNIDTGDKMMTTAGSLALAGSRAAQDAFLVQQLRSAGAVILGKTNLSEWANFRSNRSTSGWSGRGGLTKNPYALDRNTSGSSSGSGAAVAANFCAVAIGTETDGSIVSPATYCGIVGLKPTVGLVSRSGIIPISVTQDTAGPMTRTVRDAAILLSALTGVDSRDPVTAESEGKYHRDYTQFLDADGLKGARIGVARSYFKSRSREASKVLEAALQILQKAGAELIDPIDLSAFDKVGDAEYQVMLFEFKDGLNKYLSGVASASRRLKDLIDFNERHRETELPYFGQETFLEAQAKGPLTEPAYRDALDRCRRYSRTEGIDAVMNEHKLDAIVAPSGGPAHVTDLVYGDRGTGGSSSPAAVAGYPNITVPAGNVLGLPLGISFFGRAYSEPVLLKLAYGFEQASRGRKAPTFKQTVAVS